MDRAELVHFGDESKFNLLGSDCPQTGERLNPKYVTKSVKFGGGWGMFSAAGFGPLLQLHGRVNANVYQNLQHVIPPL